jgi:dTDP-3,4-didehydro-2,6-dideoxy-alpha-D-glucose 3-reductase
LHTHKTINIALIFVGEHALRNIIPILEASNNFKIIGLYFRTYDKKIVDKFNKYNIYSEYSEALNDKNVDCVYISSPNNSHFKYSYNALKSYKHVICEKPLATSYADTVKLIDKSIDVKKCIFEVFMFEYHQQFIELKNIMNDKKSGKILTLTSRFGYPHLKDKNIRYQKDLDGGAFFDCACYLIRATFLLLGDNHKSLIGDVKYERNYKVDIGGACLINYESGQSVFLDWGMGRAYSNEIDIWTENYRIKAERFFSKSKI